MESHYKIYVHHPDGKIFSGLYSSVPVTSAGLTDIIITNNKKDKVATLYFILDKPCLHKHYKYFLHEGHHLYACADGVLALDNIKFNQSMDVITLTNKEDNKVYEIPVKFCFDKECK